MPLRGAEVDVLHVVPALFGSDDGVIGGAERYVLELATHMARERPTALVSFGARDRSETRDGLRVRVIGNAWHVRGQRTNPMALALLDEVRRARVVHCHQQHLVASTVTALACRFARRRVFVSDFGGGGWDLSAYISTDRWYQGHLHISEYSRRLSGHVGKSWAHVILGGVDTEKFSPDESRKPGGTALFVGRLLPHKGVDHLVNAADRDLPLKIIGPPADTRFVRDLHALAASKPVTFFHHCDDGALIDAYRSALCVVLPSVYKTAYGDETAVPELLGQTLLEGMACGIPAVCTSVGSMPEIVDDGVTGFIVPPNDPSALRERLTWLRDHPVEARAMGLAARRRVLERFTWPAVVRRCLEIYAR
jgi:glycosyltransferase involved in cell wall biosynthesis